MNEYMYMDYDEDNSTNLNQIKVSLLNCVSEYNKLKNEELEHMFDIIWDDIKMYRTRLTIIYDGIDIISFIGYSKTRFLNHRVIKFVYLLEQTNDQLSVSKLLDGFSNYINNPYLSVITKENTYSIFEKSGFFNISLSNKEGLTFLMRKKDMLPPVTDTEKIYYYTSHKNYKRNYLLIYSSRIYFLALAILGFGFALLIHFTNSKFNLFTNPYLYIITLLVFIVVIFLSKFMKIYKQNGKKRFGFEYDMVSINTTEFKFRDKFKEYLLTGIEIMFYS